MEFLKWNRFFRKSADLFDTIDSVLKHLSQFEPVKNAELDMLRLCKIKLL